MYFNISNDDIVLKKIDKKNIDKLLKWYIHDSDSYKYATGVANKATSVMQLKNMLNSVNDEGNFLTGIYLIQNNEMIGMLKGAVNLKKEPLLWINILLIDKQYQNMGYGTSAVNLLFSHFKEKYNISRSLISVSECNSKALSFWQKLGFKECRKINVTCGLSGFNSAVVLSKKL